MRMLALIAVMAIAALQPGRAEAFCGFYVARADARLYNEASKVVLARDGDRTVITMASDYQGPTSEFALVIPVPTIVTRKQINVAEPQLVDHLDNYSAPRLVEYYDPDPCARREVMDAIPMSSRSFGAMRAAPAERARTLGVRIEAQYEVGEYDILILSATQSGGLITWLREQNYRIPDGAEPVVGSYLRQGMKFFVARVNLERYGANGRAYLRPIQVAYESPKFMLPLRLGTVNAKGSQELFLFVLSRTGRVEATNYRTVKLPSDMDVPLYVKDEFPQFYRAMFDHQVAREKGRAVFLEYAWDMSWCDPCAAEPLSEGELRQLGAMWLVDNEPRPRPMPGRPGIMRPMPRGGGGVDAFVTRLHIRYDRTTFPEDLVLQETGDRQNFQGRYVLRHPFTGESRCPEQARYKDELVRRWDRDARALADMTGWSLSAIRDRMRATGQTIKASVTPQDGDSWWGRMWGESR